MLKEIEEVLERDIRPYLKSHFGDIEIINFKDGELKVRFLGQCSNCPSAMYTMEDLVRKELKSNFDYIKNVVVDDNIDDETMDFARKLLGLKKK